MVLGYIGRGNKGMRFMYNHLANIGALCNEQLFELN